MRVIQRRALPQFAERRMRRLEARLEATTPMHGVARLARRRKAFSLALARLIRPSMPQKGRYRPLSFLPCKCLHFLTSM